MEHLSWIYILFYKTTNELQHIYFQYILFNNLIYELIRI